MPNDLFEFSARLNKLAAGLSGPMLDKVLDAAGMDAKDSVAAAGRADLGDGKFSGWPKAALAGKYTKHKDGLGLTVSREPRSAGPMRVAEEGRHPNGRVGGIQPKAGTTRITKSGARRRAAAGRRWNGTTAGKGTWSDAEALMAARLPRVVESEVTKVLTGWVNGR
jgi:hypothetical protein